MVRSPLARPPSLASTSPKRRAASQPRPLQAFSFDIDDNLFFLPTRVKLFDTQTKKLINVSSAEFAKIRTDPRYQEVPDSMRRFENDATGKHNFFKEDLLEAMARGHWQGPQFDTFVKSLSTQESAAEVTLITARGHSPEVVLEGLKVLQQQGFIKYLPKVTNIYTVSSEHFRLKYGGSMGEPRVAKAAIISELLDRLEKRSVDGKGRSLERNTRWSFSDDDRRNIESARELITQNAGRWPHVSISLIYTGPKQSPVQIAA
jgi:hypothetical protein